MDGVQGLQVVVEQGGGAHIAFGGQHGIPTAAVPPPVLAPVLAPQQTVVHGGGGGGGGGGGQVEPVGQHGVVGAPVDAAPPANGTRMQHRVVGAVDVAQHGVAPAAAQHATAVPDSGQHRVDGAVPVAGQHATDGAPVGGGQQAMAVAVAGAQHAMAGAAPVAGGGPQHGIAVPVAGTQHGAVGATQQPIAVPVGGGAQQAIDVAAPDAGASRHGGQTVADATAGHGRGQGGVAAGASGHGGGGQTGPVAVLAHGSGDAAVADPLTDAATPARPVVTVTEAVPSASAATVGPSWSAVVERSVAVPVVAGWPAWASGAAWLAAASESTCDPDERLTSVVSSPPLTSAIAATTTAKPCRRCRRRTLAPIAARVSISGVGGSKPSPASERARRTRASRSSVMTGSLRDPRRGRGRERRGPWPAGT